MLRKALAVAMILAAPSLAHAGDAEAGKDVFKKCRACHAVDGKNKVGPHLDGIFGKPAGQVEGFNYSEALKNSGKTWDEASLDAYLANPKEYIPGNKMVFAGLKDATDRANLIAYLKSITPAQ